MGNNIIAQMGVIKTRNKKTVDMLKLVQYVAQTDQNVLICGETGCGCSTVADMIHVLSNRSESPFYTVDCMDISPEDFSLLPQGCDVCIDGVQRLNKDMQKKLLVTMKNAHDIRFIAVAGVIIDNIIDRGRFYKCLYDGLAEQRVDIPPLRERKNDIIPMAREFIKKYNRKYYRQAKLDKGAVKLLKHYCFPGNTAELDSIMQRAVLLNKDGVIKTNSLMSILDMESITLTTLVKNSPLNYNKEMERYSKELIVNAIRDKGSVRGAAALLGIDHSTISKKCTTFGLKLEELIGKDN